MDTRNHIYHKAMIRMVIVLPFFLFILLPLTAFGQKYVGGDISLLPTYEDHGANYMDQNGQPISDMLVFLKEQGWNTMRVRLFVDPNLASDEEKGQGVRQDLEYVKALGKRIKDAGLKFMLDFHYSDTWADPGHQATPQSMRELPATAKELLYGYTKQCLKELKEVGATPDFIQTGNEISFGMLWDSGCKLEANSKWDDYTDTGWERFIEVLANAVQACREECPNAKIIIHTEQCANNPTLDVAFFNHIKNHEIDYDIIGTSYYPYYKGPISNLDKGLKELESNFPDKQIMVVETGCGYHYEVGDKDKQYYPLTYDGQRQFTEELITMLNKHPNVNGLLWWFPEANEYGLDWATQRVTDHWYNAGLFDNETGCALPALYELKNYNDGATSLSSITVKRPFDDTWYNINGMKLQEEPHAKGVYIHYGQKFSSLPR